jgi:uncharacterized protein YbcI
MAGFQFRYRLSGGRPTVRSFVFRNTETLSQGDILNWEDGKVCLGLAGDRALLGAAVETLDGLAGETAIRVVTDGDAVYAVADPHPRSRGDHLELNSLTGDHGVSASTSSQLTVVLDSDADAETLVRIEPGSHHRLEEDAAGRLSGGELNAAIARAVVRYHNEQLGRGPTRARAFYRDNVIVVILQDALTKAERSLAASGKTDAVRQMRDAFQEAMAPDLVATVEELTGCKVEAFMSSSHLDPDHAAEIFVLDRPVAGDSTDSG